MKKLFILFITLVVCLGLVNVNNNKVNAEDSETEIHNTTELVNFLEEIKENKSGVLANDITFEYSDTNGIKDIHIRGNNNINLDGHNILFKSCMCMYTARIGAIHDATLTIYNDNSDKKSTLKASSKLSGSAMIATRLYNQDNMMALEVNIGKVENDNAKSGAIVIDGNNVPNIIGIVAGFHSLTPHEQGYYDNNDFEVNINSTRDENSGQSIVFKNFKSSSEYGKSVAIANGAAKLNIYGADIYNCDIGVGSGHLDSNAYQTIPETVIKNTKIHDCDLGVANGVYVGSLFMEEIEPSNVYVSNNTSIYDNVVGAQFHKENVPANEVSRVFCVGKMDDNAEDNSKIYNNGIDYYCSGEKAIYDIRKLPTDVITRFAVDTEYWDTVNETDIPVATLQNDSNSGLLFTFNENLIAKFKDGTPKQVVLSVFGSDPNDPKAIQEKGDMIVKDGVFLDSFVVGQASPITARIKNIDYTVGTTKVEVFDVDDDYNTLKVDKDYALSLGSTKVTFKPSFLNKLSVGKHDFWILINNGSGGANYPFKVTVTVNAKEPDKKDESCEKVIGPTWHWNNKKGICEDTGVVKTYTR